MVAADRADRLNGPARLVLITPLCQPHVQPSVHDVVAAPLGSLAWPEGLVGFPCSAYHPALGGIRPDERRVAKRRLHRKTRVVGWVFAKRADGQKRRRAR